MTVTSPEVTVAARRKLAQQSPTEARWRISGSTACNPGDAYKNESMTRCESYSDVPRRQALENTYPTITEIAATEKINESYVGRLVRLTLLAPDIVEAILWAAAKARTTGVYRLRSNERRDDRAME